jgi:aspartate/methionine/tyrosine aminotransferase
MLRQRRARIRWLTSWLENGVIRLRFDQLAKSLRRARFIIVNSPANPTGGIFAAEDLEQIAWWAKRRDVLILNDGVLRQYEYEGPTPDIAAFRPARSRTLTVGSVSKSHALGAVRVGWLVGSPQLIRPCIATAALQTPLVPTVCQQIALSALECTREALDAIRTDFASRRRYAFERLEAMGLNPPWPAGAFFFWVPVGELGVTGRAFAEKLLHNKRVLVTPGDLFGPSGTNYVRLSYAAESGRLREGLARMSDFLRERSAAKHSNIAA